MGEAVKSTDNFMFTTSTAAVTSPDEFVVELISDLKDNSKKEKDVIKINNIDELLDFLEKTDWQD